MNRTSRVPWLSPCLCLLLSVSASRVVAQAPAANQPTLPPPRPSGEPDLLPGMTERTPFPQRVELPAQPSQKTPLEKPPPPGGESVNLPLPPVEPGDLRFPINLATALRLADARPLVVAAAQASAWAAEARLQQAKVLWVPDFNLGFYYLRHDGYGPDTLRGTNIPSQENAFGQYTPGGFGRSQNQNINFFYGGAAFFLMRNSTDMIFEPLAARQKLNARRWDIQNAKNDALFLTAKAYYDVHRFRGRYAGALDTVRKGRRLVAIINELAKDLVQPYEVDRARTLLANLEQRALTDRQNWRRSSANLTQVLRLDPRAVVEPLESDHLQITLIDPDRSLDDLIPIGLTNRPELASHQATVQAALVRVRQEKMRPILPVLNINGFQTPYEQLQVGAFGIGNGGKMNLWSGRFDIGPQILWQVDSLGLGNMAMVKWRRGEVSQATIELFKTQDMVAADVTRAQARLQSSAARVVQTERELQASLINYNGVVEGLGQTRRFGNVLQLIFRPQEAVFSLHLLILAYDDYFGAVADYNIAQFELFHALGYPARDISYLRRPGPVLPVDTTRPGALPPVGTGPPPPTR